MEEQLLSGSDQLIFTPKPIVIRTPIEAIDESLSRLDPLLARVLLGRGVNTWHDDEYALARLEPPAGMKGLAQACEVLLAGLAKVQSGAAWPILVVGDFDVDGATSVAVMLRGLRQMGFDADFFIPDRFKLGYGLSPQVVEAASLQFAPKLVITVDNGIASVEGVAAAHAQGWQVIVTDHHLPGEQLPAADAIVNPNQGGCEFASRNMAGVGVAFYVLIALRAKLREQQWPKLPHLGQLLDLVALGTVADLVPLDLNNRRLVALGLQQMRAGKACLGLQALAEVAGRNMHKLSEADLGFAFGPRLNAAGRLDDMSIGVQLLLSTDYQQALNLASQLDQFNAQRRSIQKTMQGQAQALLQAADLEDMQGSSRRSMVVHHNQWHQGVVGLVASRLKDRWYRPVVAFARVNDLELKGSGRSIPGVHLRDALDLVSKRAPGVILKFGGHAMAAGLSIRADGLAQFQTEFEQVIDSLVDEAMLSQQLVTDGLLRAEQCSLALAKTIQAAGPWGQAFPEPEFHGEFEVIGWHWLKNRHIKCLLAFEPRSGRNQPVEALYFNPPLDAYHPEPEVAVALLEQVQRIRCVYRVQINEYRNQERLQLIMSYLEPLR